MGSRSFAALGVAVLLAACASGDASAPPPDALRLQTSVDDKSAYRLGPGDELRINVYGEEDLSGEYAVDGSGTVSMPLLGEIQVAGLTLRELESQLTASLDADYLRNPSVSAEVLNYRPFYIIGEVMTGGEFPYQDGITVLNAVAIAGGFTFRARESGIEVSRGGETFVVRDPAQEPVLPGDVITVPERFF
jgi:polysaccharide export outer membrane protein